MAVKAGRVRERQRLVARVTGGDEEERRGVEEVVGIGTGGRWPVGEGGRQPEPDQQRAAFRHAGRVDEALIATPLFSRQKATSGCDSMIRARNSARDRSSASISRIFGKMPKAWIETPRGGCDVFRAASLALRWPSYQRSMVVNGSLKA